MSKNIDPRSLPSEHPFPSCSFDDPGMTREGVWQALLTWAVREAYADAGFVCDRSGLMVTEYGDPSHRQAETASVVVKTMDILARLSDDIPRECHVAFENWRITAFTCDLGGSAQSAGPLIVGLLSKHWPSADVLIDIMADIRIKVGAEIRTIQLDGD